MTAARLAIVLWGLVLVHMSSFSVVRIWIATKPLGSVNQTCPMLLTALREVLARNEANTYSFTARRVVSHYQSAKMTRPRDGAKRGSRGAEVVSAA